MPLSLPSKAWSCETLQQGLNFTRRAPMGLGDLREPDVAAMEKELASLQVGDSKCGDWVLCCNPVVIDICCNPGHQVEVT